MVSEEKIGFFQIAIFKTGVSQITGTKVRVVEVTGIEITSEGIDSRKVGVVYNGVGKIAVDHLAACKDRITTGYIIESAIFKKAKVKKARHEIAVGEIYVSKGTPSHVG